MRATPVLFLSAALLTAAALAACASDPLDDDVASADQDLTVLELTCKAPGTTFTIAPGFLGAAHEGKLTEGANDTLFICRLATPDAGAPDAGASNAIATCTERPQSVHPGRYTVDVTRVGTTSTATLRRSADGGASATTSLTCTTPPRPDAGAVKPDAAAADAASAPVPTYAEVKPILDRMCNRCHTGVFDSLPEVKQRRVQLLTAISTGKMPRGASTWRTTPDGLKVLDFLRNSPEVQ